MDWEPLKPEQIQLIKMEAVKELAVEDRERYKEKYKIYLRSRRSLWDRIFPYRIRVERK